MNQVNDALGMLNNALVVIRGFVSAHLVDIVAATAALTTLTFLIALVAFFRKRTSRRMRKYVRTMDARLTELERLEEQRLIQGIRVTPS